MTKKDTPEIIDYELNPVEVSDITIDLKYNSIDPLLQKTEDELSISWSKKELEKTIKEFNLNQIQQIKQRQKELPKQIETLKELKNNLTKQYEENSNKDLKKTILLFERIIKLLENSYNNSDKQIKQLREYID